MCSKAKEFIINYIYLIYIFKLSIDRRIKTHLQYQEEQRITMWNQINQYHKQILQHGAPDTYKDITRLNAKIILKLKEFGYVASDNNPSQSIVAKNFHTDEDVNLLSNDNPSQNENGFSNANQNPNQNENVHLIGFPGQNILDNNQALLMILQRLTENQVRMQNVQEIKPNIPVVIQKVKIPQFKGDITQYQYFKEATLKVLDGTGVQWGNIEKFVFLKDHLEDNPFKMINVFHMDNLSYEKAWEMLDKYYDSERRLLSRNMQLIMNS